MKIGIVGAGAWGTALAEVIASTGNNVTLWSLETETADQINQKHENHLYLPDITLNHALKATNNLNDLAESEVFFLTTPAQHLRTISRQLLPIIKPLSPLVICAKGIEIKTGFLLSEVLKQELENPLAVLSGPTFAKEVAQKKPTAVTLACDDPELGQILIPTIKTAWFRPYLSDDLIGCQIGGAVKNVLAIACGIVEGKNMGDNTKASLITRGLAEILRLALALGAKTETLMGLSGIGDLILTANSMQSRNFSLGFELGQGQSLPTILKNRKSVTEGLYTAPAVCQKAQTLGIEMPISQGVNALINHHQDLNEIIKNLLERPLKKEF